MKTISQSESPQKETQRNSKDEVFSYWALNTKFKGPNFSFQPPTPLQRLLRL